MIRVSPLNDRVLCIRKELPPSDTDSLIIEPDVAREAPTSFEVVAVGEGRILDNGTVIPLGIKPGDLVMAGKYTGTDFKVGREEYTIMRADEVFAVVTVDSD